MTTMIENERQTEIKDILEEAERLRTQFLCEGLVDEDNLVFSNLNNEEEEAIKVFKDSGYHDEAINVASVSEKFGFFRGYLMGRMGFRPLDTGLLKQMTNVYKASIEED